MSASYGNSEVNQTPKTTETSDTETSSGDTRAPGESKPIVEVPWQDQTPKNAPEKSQA